MHDTQNGAPAFSASAGHHDEEARIDLREYWLVLVERKTVVISCLISVLAITALFTFLAVPEYEASTTLQIERKAPEITSFQDLMAFDPAGYEDFFQTQYRIIQSRSVLQLAVKRMDLGNQPEFVNRKGSPLGRLYMWSRSLLSGGDRGERDPAARSLRFVQRGLKVRPVRKSQLVAISFLDRDAALAARVANAVADAYAQFSLAERSATTEQAGELLTREVARLEFEIEEKEKELQEISRNNKILAIDWGERDISEQALADLNGKLVEAQSRLASSRARSDAVRHAAPESLEEVAASSLIGHLKEQYATLERQYGQLSERFKPDWPELREVQEQLDQTRLRLDLETAAIAAQVREAARTEYRRALGEVEHLRRRVEAQKREVQRVARDAIEFASLRDEIESRREVLSSLRVSQNQAQTSIGLRDDRTNNIRVVERALPPTKPARPRKLLNLIVALLVGCGLGVVAAFLLHYLDNTVKTEQDIERYAPGTPVLGHIPLYDPEAQLRSVSRRGEPPAGPKIAADLVSLKFPKSVFSEACKNLRTSLLLASADHPPRTIVVTSCQPSDGKSTVAVNLAVVLAQMGRRVLLIDSDLRRPRLHKPFGLKNQVGLSNYLSHNVSDVESLVHRITDVDEKGRELKRLDLITSGPPPPNPSELLDSARLGQFVEQLTEEYDHVIFDSPPAIQIADGAILAARMDLTMLVVRAGETRRDALVQGIGRLLHGRARFAGAVLNAVPEGRGYYYYYYYRRGYYRRYGEDEPPERPAVESRGQPLRNGVRVVLRMGRGRQNRRAS